jgi:transcriptional regulator with XRE-family HTH domain
MKGIELKSRREELGLTQEELAAIVGVTRKTIGLHENIELIPKTKARLYDIELKAIGSVSVSQSEQISDHQLIRLINARKDTLEKMPLFNKVIESIYLKISLHKVENDILLALKNKNVKS